MFLPIRTSIEPKQTPYVNYFLIAANIIVYLFSFHNPTGRGLQMRPWTEFFMLTPEHPYIWQFVTYAFLHGGTMHIFGNMFFLYIFGNNVNDRLGHIGYLCFYLSGAVFSGIGHTLLSSNPVLGASGAVAAVTGAYLVLLPNSLITVVYWLFFIGTVEIRALYFIAFKLIIYDNIIAADAAHGIAYTAHLAGYAFGILAMMGLLAGGLIESNFNDLWSMIRQWNRRRLFRDTVSEGYDPFTGIGRKPDSPHITMPKHDAEKEQKILEFRSAISEAMHRRNPAEAAGLYLDLLETDSSQVLPRQLQLDVANQLMSEGKWQASADAYEKFLSLYANYEFAEQVHLMLGLLYGRYLSRPQEAIKHLETALDRLTDPGQKNLCRQEIERLKTA
jgi:membrane associated rhomboid family serine protease